MSWKKKKRKRKRKKEKKKKRKKQTRKQFNNQMALHMYPSIITLNVSGLNVPTK